MAAPGLGAFLQAQKRAKEAALARAQSQKGVSKPGESMKDQKAEGNEQEGKEPEKEKEKEKEKERVTVATLAKQVVDNATANSARMRRYDGDEDQPAVPRIVNFSDSDDDEPPLRPRQMPDLPGFRPPADHDAREPILGKRVIDSVSGVGNWLTGHQQPTMQLSTGQRGVRRIQGLWSDHGHHCLQQAKASITFTFLLKVLALWLLRRKQPRVCRMVELFCLAVPAGDALCRWQKKWPKVPGRVGEGLLRGVQCGREMAGPAAVLDVTEWLQRRTRRRTAGPSSSSDGNGTSEAADDGSVPNIPSIRTSSSTPTQQTPRTPKRLTFQDSVDVNGSPSRHLQGLTDIPTRQGVRKARSMGGTPRDKSTPRARLATPREDALEEEEVEEEEED
mmetsp:Transcript_5459/g.15597  ORF Transcript_5459/g.15597 Transcript_5459/m.15597 type:complete len:391 (+) Transcript_5459:224-1396(+)|eukprot:CAMPEP_0206137170 /NCGR_PEP_ID=MMETSP1473-20131121/2331_1 /ASSEMBLY_ACC=CAM_ASM_001109 /TAXON_ID=1461547 /ORGANISM="Stichococcus sp, Strain RCC1054" /LENGTH=390 /DNA_ID=CAMNT_0053530121 /DNA_START=151 /DNA_END=1323 /DNA_ORIENTATION=-